MQTYNFPPQLQIFNNHGGNFLFHKKSNLGHFWHFICLLIDYLHLNAVSQIFFIIYRPYNLSDLSFF